MAAMASPSLAGATSGRLEGLMRAMPRASSLVLAAAAVLLLPSATAQARVIVVAGGDAAATLTDVSTNKVAARIPLAGKARGAAVAPDGSRAYVVAGARLLAID